ncbi:MAG: radical SAM protein [Rhodobacteraceae bacterium]|nr:radical SAM protein [Paracoccaceae bacterium]
MTNTLVKFSNPLITRDGDQRAFVEFNGFKTLWFNTGTLCNIACSNCYIESSPKNDRLVYLSFADVVEFLDELEELSGKTCEIGFTGGEPFLNPDFLKMLAECQRRDLSIMVLTNAMKPLQNKIDGLLQLKKAFGAKKIVFRVSIDHYNKDLHEVERGAGTWDPMIKGLRWLRDNKYTINVAGRSLSQESDNECREGYKILFDELGLQLDAYNPNELVIFPEMDITVDVPEITTNCWEILSVRPETQMCASSRMVVKRKGQERPIVVSCTLLPYEREFELGKTLSEASKKIYLNHQHCSKFCVLGGASCS